MSHDGAAPRLTTTAHAVLGLVGVRPMAGYELASFASQTVAHMWPIAKSQVYGELARLEKAGLVSGSDIAQERLPDKRVYALTDAGRDALRSWLEDPASEPDRFRSAFLVKLFFAGQAAPEAALALLDEVERAVAPEIAHHRAIVEHLDHGPMRYAALTALCGLRHKEATLAWVREARERLSRR